MGVNRMSADISNNNVPSAPWSGVWYDLTSFVRCNIILFFSSIWIGLSHLNIYIKLILLCSSFVLDRIAVRKAEDVAIRSVDDFKVYAERNLVEEVSNRRSRYVNYSILAYCLLVLIEIIVHASDVLSNAAELRANIIVYEIAGVLYFYILSAYLFDIRVINQRLKNTNAHNINIRSVARGWFSLFLYTVVLAMTILLLQGINEGENFHLRSFGTSANYFKYGAGFFLLAITLTFNTVVPMAFKVAAYRHYLGQKVKT